MPGAQQIHTHKHVDEHSEEFKSCQALKDNGYFYPAQDDTAITFIAYVGDTCNTVTLRRKG